MRRKDIYRYNLGLESFFRGNFICNMEVWRSNSIDHKSDQRKRMCAQYLAVITVSFAKEWTQNIRSQWSFISLDFKTKNWKHANQWASLFTEWFKVFKIAYKFINHENFGKKRTRKLFIVICDWESLQKKKKNKNTVRRRWQFLDN